MQVEEKVKEVIENDLWGSLRGFWDYKIIHFGSEDGPIIFTVGLMIALIGSIIIASAILKWLRILITRKMPPEDKMKFVSIFRFVRYFIHTIIFLLILSAAGINIIVLLTASAALLVGLGLALREIFQDLIGGISIIVDKTLHVGDIIEVENKVGRVIEIKLRTTRALTRDDKIIVIPNHKFISDVVYNYTQNHKNTRELVQVRAALGSDTELIQRILIDCAKEQKGINNTPEPFVLL
ncbi:MAG TPA: mechanosensitive ion channel domain-containing protein, partial [Salinimicrobium sp.]|nr:mechanosensitive ion channel domain-containing protein [Salinimicrobium sp.]